MNQKQCYASDSARPCPLRSYPWPVISITVVSPYPSSILRFDRVHIAHTTYHLLEIHFLRCNFLQVIQRHVSTTRHTDPVNSKNISWLQTGCCTPISASRPSPSSSGCALFQVPWSYLRCTPSEAPVRMQVPRGAAGESRASPEHATLKWEYGRWSWTKAKCAMH